MGRKSHTWAPLSNINPLQLLISVPVHFGCKVPSNNKINDMSHEIIRFTWVLSLTWCPWRPAWPDARGKWRRCQQWEGIRIWTVQWISVLKVPSGQIGSAWEWYHWIGLEKDINRYSFLKIIFDLEYFIWAASCKNDSNLLLVWITVCMCSNNNLFHRTVLQKCGRDIKCSLDYGSWVKNSNISQSKPK